MLKAQDMVKLRALVPKGKLRQVISAMYDAKCIDILEHKKDELDIGTPLADSEQLSDAVVKARSILFQLGIEPVPAENAKIEFLHTTIRNINNIYTEASQATKRLKEIETRTAFLERSHKSLSIAKGLGISLDLYRPSSLVSYCIGHVSNIEGLRADIKKSGISCEMASRNKAGTDYISLFFDKNKEQEVLAMLRTNGYSELKLPAEFLGGKTALKDIENESMKLAKERSRLNAQLQKIRKAKKKELIAAEQGLSIAAKKSDAPLMFAETANVSIVTGWVPKKNKSSLEKSLKKATGGRIEIEELTPSQEEPVPIKLDNPRFAKPTEFFLRLFTMPSYREIDPTLFIVFTFPLFYGIMLGDIGYGLVTLGLFAFLKIKMPTSRDLLNIMMLAAIASIIFGLWFGEFFGFEIGEFMGESQQEATTLNEELQAQEGLLAEPGAEAHAAAEEHASEEPHSFGDWITTWPLHRNPENTLNLIILTMIIGVLHVNFGVLLGFINVFRQHGIKHAILEKFSWVVLEIGLPLAILALAGIVPQYFVWVGLGLVLVAAVMLYKGEGIQGLVELPSIFVHIGSYLRLMAIGLASVSLAVVINDQTQALFGLGIVGIIGGIIIFVIGHVINIALGVIGPFLHSIRLHYVEHFTKFYKGGGTEFQPFGANGG